MMGIIFVVVVVVMLFYLLMYICRCSAQDELSAEDFLSAVKGTYQWRQPSLAAVYHVWKESGPALIASMKEHALSVGQVGSSTHCLKLFVVWTGVHWGGDSSTCYQATCEHNAIPVFLGTSVLPLPPKNFPLSHRECCCCCLHCLEQY